MSLAPYYLISVDAPADQDTFEWIEDHPEEMQRVALFVGQMLRELAANDDKGNRPGWLQMDRKEAVSEVHWHASKLAVAAKELDRLQEAWPESADLLDHPPGLAMASDVREYAADVANCALMVLDCMGLLGSHLDPEAA